MKIREYEQALAGAIIAHPEAVYRVPAEFQPEAFETVIYRGVYQVTRRMLDSGITPDLIMLSDRISEAMKRDCSAELAEALQHACMNVYIPEYARIVSAAGQMREIKTMVRELPALVNDAENPIAALDEIEKRLYQIAVGRTGLEKTQEKAVTEALIKLGNATERRNNAVMTGYDDIDHIIGGLKKTHLIVIAARPGGGKSLASCDIARRIVKMGEAIGFFTFEMTQAEMIDRMVAAEISVNHDYIANPWRAEEYELDRAIKAMTGSILKWPITWNTEKSCTIAEIKSLARHWKTRDKIKALFIDQLSFIKIERGMKFDNRTQRYEYIVTELKELAKQLEIPIVLMAQLNRESDRADRTPNLSDLKDSSAIEEKADVVILLHRDEEEAPGDRIKVIIAKNRHGAKGVITMQFNGHYCRLDTIPGL